MKKKVNKSDSSCSTTTAPGGRAINYSRWLSDLYPQIADKKWVSTVFPSSHNAGADKDATGGPSEYWVACQDRRFLYQLRDGARVLDLRLYDKSYKKTTGNHNPTTRTYYVFKFQHGNHGNRSLEDLIADLLIFFRENPGEPVILDFHTFDKGRLFAHSSLSRLLTHLKALEGVALSYKANNFTWKKIRETGRNLFITGAFGDLPEAEEDPENPDNPKNPPGWSESWISRRYLWAPITHYWSPEDSSEKGIEALVTRTMSEPPMNSIWSLSAAVYAGGPKHLNSNHPIRLKTFAAGFENASIVNVDFITRPETRSSAVDKCIELTLRRAQDTTPPVAPKNFTVEPQSLYEADKVNTVKFAWGSASDNVGVRYYRICVGDRLLYVTNQTTYTAKDLPRWNGMFRVQAEDGNGNLSPFSNEVELIQDKKAPTIPGNPRFSLFGLPVIRVEWDGSSDGDGIGVKDYEVRMDGVVQGATRGLKFDIYNVPPSESRFIEVRSRDHNDNVSEWTGILRRPIPELKNMQVCYVPIDLDRDPLLALATLTWDPIPDPGYAMPIGLAATSKNIDLPPLPIEYGTPISFLEYVRQEEKFELKVSLQLMESGEKTNPKTIVVDVDMTLPQPVENFKIVSETATGLKLAWDKSSSKDIVNYAISVNENPPLLLAGSVSEYELGKVWGSEEVTIEIWAIDEKQNPSIAKPLTISAPALPVPEIIEPADRSTVTTTTPEVRGINGMRGATVRFYQAGSGVIEYGTALVREDGGWSAPPETPFPPGDFDLTCDEIHDGQQSGYSKVVTFTINPGNPGELSVTDITSTSARLEWTFPGGSGIRFRIKVNGFVVAQTGETFFQLNYLRYFTEYKVEVYAFAEGWVSEPSSATFKTLVHPPTNLRFSQSNGNCKLRWGPLWGTSLTHEISINDKVFNTPAGRWGYNFKLADILPGPPYHLVIKVRAQIGDDKSEEVVHEVTLSDGAPPGAPGKPVASEITDTYARLDWAQPSSNDAVAYIMYLNGLLFPRTSDNYYILDKLKAGNYYHVAVRAIDKDGNKSATSQPTSFKTPGQPASPPPLPPEIKLANPTPTRVTLQWSASGAVAGIRIIVNDEHYADWLLYPALGISDLVPGERYKIEVFTFDLQGQLSELPATVVYEPVVTTPPSAPGSFEVSEQVGNSVNLAWAPSENEFGAGAYFVYWGEVCLGRTEVPSFTATYLPPGSHVIQVREMDPFGNLSEVASIQVDIEPDSIN